MIMKTNRRKFTATFKAKVAIEALKERESLAELSQKFEVHANIISKWKQEFIKGSSLVFEKGSKESPPVDIEKLYSKIGQLEIEKDFLKKACSKAGL
jgi:transposase-like protein